VGPVQWASIARRRIVVQHTLGADVRQCGRGPSPASGITPQARATWDCGVCGAWRGKQRQTSVRVMSCGQHGSGRASGASRECPESSHTRQPWVGQMDIEC
jgi:hypothetical protein